MTDRALIRALLDCARITEREREAFESMEAVLVASEGRTLSAKQREWAVAVGNTHGLTDEVSLNLWSSGKVPIGLSMPKTRGEQKAREVLAIRPLKPPGR